MTQTVSKSDTTDNRSFYEGLCADYPNQPTHDRVAVVVSDSEKGEGLLSLRNFRPGEIVFKFWGPKVSKQTLFTLQQSPGVYIEDPLVMGKVLHACDPNMICDMATLTFTAAKPIATGDYLTMDYETTEDELFRPFTCLCGSPKCRGPIKGRFYAAGKK